MKTVQAGYGGAYYQLTGSSSNSSSNFLPRQKTVPLALGGVSANTASVGSAAFLLDLSPAAQQVLRESQSGDVPSAQSPFALSKKQERAIDNVLVRYKDAPQDQATFNQIQDDLRAANVGPEQLSLVDRLRSFNVTQIFLNGLGGDYADLASLNKAADDSQKGKSEKYMGMIVQRWKELAAEKAAPAEAA